MMTFQNWITLTLVAVVCVGCNTALVSQNIPPGVAAVSKGWASALSNCDGTHLASLYDNDAVIYGEGWPRHFKSIPEVRQYAQQVCEVKGKLVVTMKDEIVQRLSSTDYVLSGTFTISRSPDFSVDFRHTFVIQQFGLQWKIVNHHASPIPRIFPPQK